MAASRRRTLATLLLALALVTAGCLTDEEADGAGAADAPDEASEDGPAPEANVTREERPNATLEEAPDLRAGDWWDVTVESPFLGETYETRRVVAGAAGGDVRVGLAPYVDGVVFGHLPAVGNVRASDLSYLVHDERFHPLSFPLTEGTTWTTTYIGIDFEATVEETEGTQAKISYEEVDGNTTMAAVYDAQARALKVIEGPLGTRVEVTDHGTGHEGEVVVPHDRSQRLDGRFLGAFDFEADPAPPAGSIEVPEGFDRAVVGLLLGGFGETPGYYREVAHAPDGETFSATSTGPFTVELAGHDDPSGTWDLEHQAGGAGFVATELILFEVDTVTLPLPDDPLSPPSGGS